MADTPLTLNDNEMEKLPVEFKKKWLEALRSGKYEQGKGELFYEGKYCCLGVAAAECGVPLKYIKGKGFLFLGETHFDSVPNILRGSFTKPIPNSLSAMNDNGKTFTEIANWIEENL